MRGVAGVYAHTAPGSGRPAQQIVDTGFAKGAGMLSEDITV